MKIKPLNSLIKFQLTCCDSKESCGSVLASWCVVSQGTFRVKYMKSIYRKCSSEINPLCNILKHAYNFYKVFCFLFFDNLDNVLCFLQISVLGKHYHLQLLKMKMILNMFFQSFTLNMFFQSFLESRGLVRVYWIPNKGLMNSCPIKSTAEKPKFILMLVREEVLFTSLHPSPSGCLLTPLLLPGFGWKNGHL